MRTLLLALLVASGCSTAQARRPVAVFPSAAQIEQTPQFQACRDVPSSVYQQTYAEIASRKLEPAIEAAALRGLGEWYKQELRACYAAAMPAVAPVVIVQPEPPKQRSGWATVATVLRVVGGGLQGAADANREARERNDAIRARNERIMNVTLPNPQPKTLDCKSKPYGNGMTCVERY